MNYDLAKELEQSGFPQGGDGSWVLPPDQLVSRRTDRVYVPTLSELIEACGEQFFCLIHRKRKWAAYTGDERGELQDCIYFTAEEAVARLWLALTKV